MNPTFSILHERYNAIFIHIPKAAGSSIEKALYGTWGQVGHKKAITYRQADINKFNQYYKFSFTRNPYDRFVSAYNYLSKGGRNKYDKAWADKHLIQYTSFNDFVIALKNTEIKEEIFNYIHFIPQYQFISDENKNIIIDEIFKFESINKDFLKLSQKLKINTPLSHENECQHLPYEEYYNIETKLIVAQLYKADFELLNYTM